MDFFPLLLAYCSLGKFLPLSEIFIRSLAKILLLKLNYTSIRHMVLIFDVRTPFPFFSRIAFMFFFDPLVHILLFRGYGKGRIQNMKGMATGKIIWCVSKVYSWYAGWGAFFHLWPSLLEYVCMHYGLWGFNNIGGPSLLFYLGNGVFICVWGCILKYV